jgi:hypothetical protein
MLLEYYKDLKKVIENCLAIRVFCSIVLQKVYTLVLPTLLQNKIISLDRNDKINGFLLFPHDRTCYEKLVFMILLILKNAFVFGMA